MTIREMINLLIARGAMLSEPMGETADKIVALIEGQLGISIGDLTVLEPGNPNRN